VNKAPGPPLTIGLMGELVKNNKLGCKVVAEGFNGPTFDSFTKGWTAK
jgi:hypothetical protein